MNTNKSFTELENESRNESKCLGILKFFYYMSPLGYILNKKAHDNAYNLFWNYY
jgi:hypothetical protein